MVKNTARKLVLIFKCEEIGHTAKHCRIKGLKEYKEEKPDTAVIKAQSTLVKDSNKSKSGKWMFDLGSTCHTTNSSQNSFEFKESVGSVQIGNNDVIKSKDYRSEKVKTVVGCTCHVITLHNLLYVWDIMYNLIFIHQARENCFKTIIDNSKDDCQMGKIELLYKSSKLWKMASIETLDGVYEAILTKSMTEQTNVTNLKNPKHMGRKAWPI